MQCRSSELFEAAAVGQFGFLVAGRAGDGQFVVRIQPFADAPVHCFAVDAVKLLAHGFVVFGTVLPALLSENAAVGILQCGSEVLR